MAGQVANYQCPNCTGPLKFAGSSGQLECEHCGTNYDVKVVEELYADKEQEAAAKGSEPVWDTSSAGGEWSQDELSHIVGFTCPSCAAGILCDDTTSATSCPYCGNPTTIPGRLAGQLKPDLVIPFKLDKKNAVDALKRYYSGKKFLPKLFSEDSIVEQVKGVYVPFWLFDGESDAVMRFHGTIVKTRTSSDYEITITEHYRILREGNIKFEKVPVNCSSKMPDAHMDSVEPYNYSELKNFSTAYLPGFLADRFDVDSETCGRRANERIKASTEAAFRSTVGGYSSVRTEYTNIRLKRGTVRYALLPVWLLTAKWSEQDFLFAVNGQTGKLVGNLPVDKFKFMLWFAAISLPLMIILGVLLLR